MNNNDIITQVAIKTQIYEGSEGVRNILRAILRHAPVSSKDVSKYTHIPVPVVSAVRRELEHAGILVRKNGMSLSNAGKQYVKETLRLRGNLELTKHEILDPNFAIPKTMDSLIVEMQKYVAEAPKFDPSLDQTPCTAETAIRRALLMYVQGAIEGKRIALIGDDDLVSIAICLVAKYAGDLGIIPQLVVIDIDSRFITYINSIALKEKFPIKCIRHDIRMPLPKKLIRQFDVVETDPPYSILGAELFLSRSIELLVQEAEKLLFLSFAHWPADKKMKLEKIFGNLALSVENQHHGFNEYYGASILGSTGTLFEIHTTSLSVSPIINKTFSDTIYTADQTKKK